MTVITGGSRSDSRFWAWHLQRTDRGQTVAVRDVVGLLGNSMEGWFEQIETMALGGRTENPFYHFTVNPRPGEPFTPEQKTVAVETALRNLGLEGQPYFEVEHGGKDGRPDHIHVIALRVSLDTGKAISDSHNYRTHQRTADELEQLFGHERTERKPDREKRKPKNYEVQRGKDTKLPVKQVEAELQALWRQADNAPAFAASLGDAGYILCEGDRGLCVVDPAGKEHSLYRLLGLRKKELDPRMEGVDRDALPTVAEARWLARHRDQEGDDKKARSGISERSAADKAVQGMIEEVVYSATERAFVTRKRPAEKHSHESEQKPAAPAAPVRKPEPSLFERLAKTLADAAHFFSDGPTAAESLDVLAPPPPAPLHEPPGIPEPTVFERVATEFMKEAEEAAPVVEGLAAVTTVAVGHAPTPERELSAFERLAEEHFEAVRQAGSDGLFIPEGLTWLAEETGTPLLPAAPPDGERDAFERMTRRMHEAARDNGGEPEPGFWQRGVALLSDLRDRTIEWMEKAARNFSERITRGRADDPEQHGRER